MPWFLYTVMLFAPYMEQTPEEEAAEQLSKVRRIYIAVLTGGQFISEDLGLKLENITLDQMGSAKTVRVEKDGI